MISYVGLLTIKEGKRDEYLDELRKTKMIDVFRAQKGNIYYQVGKSMADENCVIVTDGWDNEENFSNHDTCEIVENVWRPLAAQYVIDEEHYLLETIKQ